VVRLFYDLSGRVYAGESDVVKRVDTEKDPEARARMLFYLASYYEFRGNASLADRFLVAFRETYCASIPEWRLAGWMLEDRGLAAVRR